MPQISIPASKVGKIMTQPQNKKEREADLLSSGAKTFLDELAVEKFYGRKELLRTKQTMKGEMLEEEAITWIQYFTGGLLWKNDDKYGGPPEHFSGYPDILEEEEGDLVIDAKVPFDLFNFAKAEPPVRPSGKLNDYGYQLQAYMHLTGRSKACLAYVLLDTPDSIVNDITYRESYKFEDGDQHEEWEEYEKHIRRNHEFSDIPDDKRVKLYWMNRDQETIDRMVKKAEDANEYLKNWSL